MVIKASSGSNRVPRPLRSSRAKQRAVAMRIVERMEKEALALIAHSPLEEDREKLSVERLMAKDEARESMRAALLKVRALYAPKLRPPAE